MAIKIYKFATIDLAQHFLDGGIVGGEIYKSFEGGQGGISGLVGKTLTFTAPAGAVVFAAGVHGDRLLPLEIKAQIEAAVAGLTVVFFGGRIGFIDTDLSAAVQLSANDEIAKAILGFPKNKAVVGKVYGAVAPAPYYMDSYAPNDGSHVIYVME